MAIGIMIPFLGTTAGAAMVFFLRSDIAAKTRKCLLGFAAGIMLSASLWSLLIPAISLSECLGKMAFMPATVGVILGMLALLMLDRWISGYQIKGKKQKLLFMAVAFHNIPEGIVVGAAFAGMTVANIDLSPATVLALSIGIGLQNIPEGAIISLPLKAEGKSRLYAWFMGTITGLVELIAAIVTLFLFAGMETALPYMLSLAAGAMIHVVVKELIPELFDQDAGNAGYWGFVLGFVLMMILDVMFA